MRKNSNYRHCDFFVLRSPLLAYDQLMKFFTAQSLTTENTVSVTGDDDYANCRKVSGNYLLNLLDDKKIQEALWLASPGLSDRLANIATQKDPKKYSEALATVYKYYSRMTTRCTPFGLFASCTYGTISRDSQFEFTKPVRVNRVTRLDAEYLYRLVSALNSDRNLRKSLKYRSNSSLYPVGERLHYAEAQTLPDKPGVSYKLSAVDITDYLILVLEKAEAPVSILELSETLCESDSEISMEDASEYINDLIDSQLLVPELTPNVTGISPLSGIIAELDGALDTLPISRTLKSVAASLINIDAEGLGVNTQRYQTIVKELAKLPAKVEEKHLFQVDVNFQFQVNIGQKLADEILAGAELLQALVPPLSGGILDTFKREFRDRYEDQEVPLYEILDDDVGIGFDGSNNKAFLMEPLLNGIAVFNNTAVNQAGISPRETFLMDKIQQLTRHNETELRLDADLIKSLANKNPKPLPDAWSALVTIFGSSNSPTTDHHFLLKSVSGPGAANLLGRFCHLNDELEQAVKRCLLAEESLKPEATFAEIAHMPEGRIGNVIQRPVLRNYEIVYLGKSGIQEDHQISIRDLLVSVRENRIILKSGITGSEILPRLTSAHNFWSPVNLRIYRFLCLLQQQDIQAALAWNWGALNALSFLPRVIHEHMILSPASWRLQADDIKLLTQPRDFKQFQAVQILRKQLKIRRRVQIAEFDNELTFDLDCPLSVEVFCEQLKKYKGGLRVHEELSEQFGMPLKINGEPYANEVLIPFVRHAN